MKIIMVPGFWLGAWSWDRIAPALGAAGHEVVALTLPGLESVDTDRAGIGLAEHVAAVVAEIDRSDEPVVLVGHSGGGTVVHAAVDQRPDRVARAVYVDSGPLPHGTPTNPHLPSDGPDLPLPEWDVFRADGSHDLDDFTDAQLADFRERAVPHPAAAAQDPQVLSNEARYAVPVTLITTTFTREQIDTYTAAGEAYFAELPKIADVTIVELPTSHWPQFTKPEQLAEVLRDAI
ncbi:esterase [Aeromicrobium sp. Root344]|uniref:alpha/beta fold hydrolase n=1 Tax=Aeromicrobium sp. Root344 TaxID=1736521 RepID=UPI0007000CED|nr:alpha/beta hydrolase [Aeromicrobium sp. Root344]KQV76284.1 esterase [Aeromicrobium sp. Root344]